MNKSKKLEIGSGSKPKEGYLHFDIRSNIGADFVGNATKLPFKNNEFDEVYSRFFLEHLNRNEAKKSLNEMFRVLKPKGILEIIVPNLAYFCKLFISETGRKKKWALNKIYGFEKYPEDHHYFGYDFETLNKILKETGFNEITLVDSTGQYLHIKAKK